nr:uncharacterized protein LOC119186258 [Rhipicephalus microplus]
MQLHNLERNDSFDMRGYMQPFKAGSDITLYLVNFERTCTRAALAKETWSQRLLTLLPNEAADVIARMPDEDAHDYEKVKLHLRRRYSLSTEALRMKFRNTRRGQGESFSEFAYKSMSLLEEWLKSANAYEDKQRLIELFALEQFYASIPDQMRLWIQDKPNVETLQTAASLADEYRSRRMESSEEQRKKPSGAFKKFQKGTKETNQGKPGDSVPAQGHAANASEPKSSKFEEKQPLVCFNANLRGRVPARRRAMPFPFPSAVATSTTSATMHLRVFAHAVHKDNMTVRNVSVLCLETCPRVGYLLPPPAVHEASSS